MYGDNPAGRLLSIVEAGRDIDPTIVAHDAWCVILGVQRDHTPTLLERVGRVMALPGQVVAQLESNHPRQFARNTHQHMVGCFFSAFSRNIFGTRWADYMSPIDTHTIQFLSSMDELFESKQPGKALTSEQLQEIRSSTNELIDFVLQSSFPDDLKKVLLDRLKVVVNTIDTYFITGAAPILDAVLCSVAHANLSENGKISMSTAEGKSFMDRLATLANLVTVVTGIVAIGQASAPMLAYVTK